MAEGEVPIESRRSETNTTDRIGIESDMRQGMGLALVELLPQILILTAGKLGRAPSSSIKDRPDASFAEITKDFILQGRLAANQIFDGLG